VLVGPVIRRLDAEDGAVVLVRQHVEQPVGPLPHVPDPSLHRHEERLASQFLHLLVEQNPLEAPRPRDLARTEAADEHLALIRTGFVAYSTVTTRELSPEIRKSGSVAPHAGLNIKAHEARLIREALSRARLDRRTGRIEFARSRSRMWTIFWMDAGVGLVALP
jgi:hypothetical protein